MRPARQIETTKGRGAVKKPALKKRKIAPQEVGLWSDNAEERRIQPKLLSNGTQKVKNHRRWGEKEEKTLNDPRKRNRYDNRGPDGESNQMQPLPGTDNRVKPRKGKNQAGRRHRGRHREDYIERQMRRVLPTFKQGDLRDGSTVREKGPRGSKSRRRGGL